MNKAGKKYIGNVNPQHAMAIEAIIEGEGK